MGYAYYGTPLGPAGYSVTDTCHHSRCPVEIDRGLAHLCGNEPGREDEVGCGRWFCGTHLMVPVPGCHHGTCATCWQRWEAEHPDHAEPDTVPPPTPGLPAGLP